jgi:CDGSH-type Zn-finger protein
MSEQPLIAGREPIGVEVKVGRDYWWCACGRSKNQPFCDGSHKGTAFEPVKWTAPASEEVWFCVCKRTTTRPMCSGAHETLG